MIRDTVLQKSPRVAEPRFHCVVPVLIKVPTISVASGSSWRPGARVGPRRRRLRREVRIVGYALMTAVVLSTLLPWGNRPARTPLSNPLPTHTGHLRADHRGSTAHAHRALAGGPPGVHCPSARINLVRAGRPGACGGGATSRGFPRLSPPRRWSRCGAGTCGILTRR